eukprot:CAMPEP_0169179832 /NCGR_PEP_ID=MMETSP1015-20121227/67855_1 /TAXON_ID=342587 /ORGANISM="Karlodinium micrum, Strain CCMP2283" /LENGTH=52 /DNA_ID=CAMNT_0009254915 /DNA_START=75 /DNA_END=229 /DNA_ORIENTATION=-
MRMEAADQTTSLQTAPVPEGMRAGGDDAARNREQLLQVARSLAARMERTDLP